MKPRFLILLTVAGGLAIYMAVRASSPPVETIVPDRQVFGKQEKDLDLRQQLLSQRPLAGEEPAERAELWVDVEVDPSSPKNRLYYYITEAHGYYVESFKIEFYYKPAPDQPLDEDAIPVFTHYANDYVKAGETQKGCLEVVPAELLAMRGRIGRSENWEATVVWYGRARVVNPDPLPPVDHLSKCN